MSETITEVFSKENCPYCVQAKRLLTARGIEYREINVMEGTDEEIDAKRAALIDRVVAETGDEPKTLPQIFFEGEYVGGFDDLKARLG